MVSVEPVAGQEHREEEDDVPVSLEGIEETEDFALPGRILHHDDFGSVLTFDELRITEEAGQDKTGKHENHEGDVCAVIDAAGAGIEILTQWDQGSKNTAQIEDHPEPGDVATFGLFSGVAHHHGTLCGP